MSQNHKTPIHQRHGDHLPPFFNVDEFLNHLNDMIQESRVIDDLETEVRLENAKHKIKTKVIATRFKHRTSIIKFLILFAYNENQKCNELVACYPYLNGFDHEVEISEVIEWDNCIEASVRCIYRNKAGDKFEFWFFCADYYKNKAQYKIGAKVKINLAASCLYGEEGSTGFVLTGQSAIDFLAKMGKRPTYNDKGEVEPVKINTANTVAFMPNDESTPDIAEFMSPLKEMLGGMPFFNRKISCGEILISSNPALKVELYYNYETKIRPGHPIMGKLWLSGYIAEQNR